MHGTEKFKLQSPKYSQWEMNPAWGLLTGAILMVGIICMTKEVEFIYFLF